MADTKDPYKNLTDDDLINKVKEFRQDCEMGNADLFARMIKAERFAQTNDQWDPQDRHYREQKRKFCLTIPLIKPQIKQVVGAQIQNPKDIVVAPERAGSATGAKILSKLAKHAMDSESAMFEETAWFEAGLSSGVGFIIASIDRHEDPKHGNLTIERANEFECGLDPTCTSYDINSYMIGAKYFIWEPWVDKDLINAKYPKKADDIEGSGQATSLKGTGGMFGGLWSWLSGRVSKISSSITGAPSSVSVQQNIEKYKYRVTHTWWRRPKRCVVFYDNTESDMDAMTLTKDEDIRAAKKIAKRMPEQYSVEEVVVNVITHTIRVGDVLLENIEDELNGVTMFPIGVYSAYFSNGYRSGMAEDLIGTQEEINWSHSQNLMVIKHLSTFHWKIGKDTSGQNEAWLRAHADEDNLVLDESRFGGKVEKSQSRPYLSGLDRFALEAKENMKLISNVRTEDPSFDTKNMSGRAIIAKQVNSQTGQAPVMKNFDYSLSLFSRLVIEIIRANDIYSPDEIRAIVEDDDLIDAELMSQAMDMVTESLQSQGMEVLEAPKPPMNPMGQPDPMQMQSFAEEVQNFAQFQAGVEQLARPIAEDLLFEEIKNLRKGRYTTKVTMSSYAPTMRLAEYGEAMELNKALIESGHMPLPRKRLIEASDISNKEELLRDDEAMAKMPPAMPGMAGPPRPMVGAA